MEKIEKVLEILKEQGLDGIYITKEANVKYISGYPDELAYALICPQGNYLITDSRFTELAEQSCPDFEVVNWHNCGRSIPKAVESICVKDESPRFGLNAFKVFREAYLVAGDYPHDSMYLLQHLFNNWFRELSMDKLAAGAVMTAGVILFLILLLRRAWETE